MGRRGGLASVALLALALVAPAMAPPATASEAPRRVFISGHSLTDRPIPDMVAAMAAAAGDPIVWQRQHIGGSTIRQRSSGIAGTPPGSGFSAGVDKDGQPIDVLAAFAGRTDDGRPAFDMLIITERHRVLDVLAHEDTANRLAAFQDRFIAANPNGVTWFYAPWADIADKEHPQSFVSYERAASPIWRCAVEQANAQRDGSGHADRIRFIPAALALAELVGDLAHRTDVPGFEGLSTRARVETLFSDNVHVTPLGAYFAALITFGVALGGDVANAWQPTELDPARSATLRRFAAGFLARWRAEDATPSPAACAGVPLAFIRHYALYMQQAYRPHESGLQAFIARQRETLHYYLQLK